MFQKRFSLIFNSCILILGIGVLLTSLSQSFADIYCFKDKDGVVHFTNVPTDPRCKVIIREKRFHPRSIKYEALISEISARYMVDDALIKAIIKVESDFNPEAVSIAGAKGLMQLMPKTAEKMRVKDLFDPQENIEGGTRFLKHLLDKFKKNLPLVIAAYHAGEKAVMRYNGIPPFDSTQQFVRMVLNHFEKYRE